jgi:hypothetical protein
MISSEDSSDPHLNPSKHLLLNPPNRRNLPFILILKRGFKECELGEMFSLQRQEVQRLL